MPAMSVPPLHLLAKTKQPSRKKTEKTFANGKPGCKKISPHRWGFVRSSSVCCSFPPLCQKGLSPLKAHFPQKITPLVGRYCLQSLPER
jgi:hypothetical protein